MAAKKNDGTWEDCGCPLGMGHQAHQADMTPLPHMCMISRDEHNKHYIFDRYAYDRIILAPLDDPLGGWVARRLQENRLFVVKPPVRPPLPPQPWRYDEPTPHDVPLKPGWRYWIPNNPELGISELFTVEEYEQNIDDFFAWMGVNEAWRKLEMKDTAEGWMLACGTSDLKVGVRGATLMKIDRVYVTADFEFFNLLMDKWHKISSFTNDLKIGDRMTHMKRLMDIRIDAKIKEGWCGHVFNS